MKTGKKVVDGKEYGYVEKQTKGGGSVRSYFELNSEWARQYGLSSDDNANSDDGGEKPKRGK